MGKETQRAFQYMEWLMVLTPELGHEKGKVNIIGAPFQKFYFGMKFLDVASQFIGPYASTLFIMDNGQVYAMPIRQEVEKERVLLVF